MSRFEAVVVVVLLVVTCIVLGQWLACSNRGGTFVRTMVGYRCLP